MKPVLPLMFLALAYLILSISSVGLFLMGINLIPKIWLSPKLYFFWLGILAFPIMLYSLSLAKRDLKWVEVFTHELIHAFFIILTFKRMHAFSATNIQGGFVRFRGSRSLLVSLSPYCIPLFTVLLLLFFPVIAVPFRPYISGLVGFTYAFHLRTFWKQTRFTQPDLHDFGLRLSLLFILTLNLFFLVAVPFVSNQFGNYSAWWVVGRSTLGQLKIVFLFLFRLVR